MLKRIGPNGIEETDKLGAKVVSVTEMTVSPDGRTMTTVSREANGHVSTLLFDSNRSDKLIDLGKNLRQGDFGAVSADKALSG
jgi:hypothetical protein